MFLLQFSLSTIDGHSFNTGELSGSLEFCVLAKKILDPVVLARWF
uniref:Uncharacterized protein n=1 Tax=Rhizophora mucronata TaxID=61149 RepID=A0A2P2NCP0_RHIMU